MDELTFYKRQYAFLMGEMDRAIGQLDDERPDLARQTLVQALRTAEELWMETFQ